MERIRKIMSIARVLKNTDSYWKDKTNEEIIDAATRIYDMAAYKQN